MVNFMYQFDQIAVCTDNWLNFILSMSVGVFLDEINIRIIRLSKAYCPPQYGGLIEFSGGLYRTTTKKAQLGRISSLCLCLSLDIGLMLLDSELDSDIYINGSPGAQAFKLN